MFSNILLKRTVKDNFKFWAIMTVALSVLLVSQISIIKGFADRPIGSGGAMFGGAGMIFDQFYTLLAMLLPLICIVNTSNKLIAAQIDNGSLAYIMSKPLKRNQVSFTLARFLIGAIVSMFTVITLTGLAAIGIMGADIEIGSFLLLNLGITCFNLAISGISFMASCILNTSSKSLLFGAGIPVVFFVFNLLSKFSTFDETWVIFKYLTINTLYNTADILAYSTNIIWQFAAMFGIALACYNAGIMVFKKKDLPL